MLGYSKPGKRAQGLEQLCLWKHLIRGLCQSRYVEGHTLASGWRVAQPWSQARQHRQGGGYVSDGEGPKGDTAGNTEGDNRGSCQAVGKEGAGLASVWGSFTLGPPEATREKSVHVHRAGGGLPVGSNQVQSISHKQV